MRLSAETVERFFPEDSLVPLWREGQLYLLPTRGAAAGGLMLKQGKAAGQDQSILVFHCCQYNLFALEPNLKRYEELTADACLALPAALVKQEYEAAISLATDAKLPGVRGELWAQLGMLIQQVAGESRFGLLEAVKAYQNAIACGIDEVDHPQLFADLQNNLGLAYLAMSHSETGNQLRVGVAIQSFRKALDVINAQRETSRWDAELWARINMNLASALQYAPSSQPADNLANAVQIYEEVLQYRTKERDPVAYALVLYNQANALAHLGIFKHAFEKAAEAYKLFQWYDQIDQAVAVRDLVEQVNLQCSQNQETHGTV